jgi:hypothetical protein
MSGLGVRVFLAAHARYNGKPPLLLPSAKVASVLGIERMSLKRGRDEVVAAGLLIQTRTYIRPGGPGGGSRETQRAAEWDLPHANRGRHEGAPVSLEAGDERLFGYWRIMSADLLRLVGVTPGPGGELRQYLTDTQLRVLIVLAQGPRTNGGALQDAATQRLTVRDVVDRLPGMTLRTAQRAIPGLEQLGLARKIGGGRGSAAARYEPAGLVAAGVPWKRKRKP